MALDSFKLIILNPNLFESILLSVRFPTPGFPVMTILDNC